MGRTGGAGVYALTKLPYADDLWAVHHRLRHVSGLQFGLPLVATRCFLAPCCPHATASLGVWFTNCRPNLQGALELWWGLLHRTPQQLYVPMKRHSSFNQA